MKNKLFILLSCIFIGTTIRSKTNIICTDQVAEDETSTYCEIITMFREVKFMPEGLFLIDYTKKGDPILFVKRKNVNYEKWEEFQQFLKINDFFSYKDEYDPGFT